MNTRDAGGGTGLFGAIGGWLGNRFSGDPSKEYEKNLDPAFNAIRQGVDSATGYLNPYRSGGMQALDKYMGMLDKYNDPSKYYDEVMSGWSMSPGSQNRLNRALDQVQNTLSSRGMTGSGQEMTDLARTTSDYIGEDQRNYFNDIMGIGRTALGGYQDLTHLGEKSATTSGGYQMQGAGDIASLYAAIARAKAEETANRRRSNRDLGAGFGGWIDKGIQEAGSIGKYLGLGGGVK